MLIQYFRGGNFLDTAFYNPLTDDFALDILSASSTQILGVNPGTLAVTVFTGTGFSANPVPPLSGTLTGFSIVNAQGQPLATITGINWPLQAALTAIEAAVGADALGQLQGLLSLQDITLDASAAVEGLFGLDFAGVTSDITVIGSGFADDIFGGAGDDTIDPGAASVSIDEPDVTHGSTGNDTLDFSGLASGNTFSVLTYEGLTGPITLNINALTNIATVAKGPGQGTDTLVDVANLMTSDVDIYGTAAGDSFTVRTVEDISAWLIGGRGADSFNLTLAAGSGITWSAGDFVEGGTQGIIFNATTGVIANDGFGFADALALTRVGDVNASSFTINATSFADNITGSAGRDRFRSRGGDDTLDGGAGIDLIQFNRPQTTTGVTVDLVALTATGTWEGVAFVKSLTNIEEVTGSRFDDSLRGDAQANLLNGHIGNDTLDGGAGNDRYVVERAADVVIETFGNGTGDRVLSSVSYALAAAADIELLTTTSSAGSTAINLTGNGLAQAITGNAGVNTLSDGGGAGVDTLSGLGGNDTYVVRNAAAVIIEGTGQGTADRVAAGVSFVLAADDQIELLTTSSSSGTTAINLTGNVFSQATTGNAGVNVLSDGGGAGADTLTGLAGNDTYVVRNAGSLIVEGTGQGTADRVAAGVSFVLAADDQIELLTTGTSTGTTAINLTGNGFAQTITGNAGVNTLHDGGGSGLDTLTGLGGNDTYRIFNSMTQIIEVAGGGTADRVSAAVSFGLSADDNIEILTTTASTGTLAINLTGNALAQAVTGNAGINVLNGLGGLDTLTGGSGADAFVFSSALGAGNVDTITDFNVIADTIRLENAIFTGLVAGALTAAAFRANLTGQATDASDRIIHETDTGALFFDADGTGAGVRVRFAVLDAGLALTQADFLVI